MSAPGPVPAHSDGFGPVLDGEQAWLAARRQACGLPPPDDDAVGLALSGGGIRSAVFNLGLLQALEQGGVMRRVDYLSSVSGGGYIAACYSWLRHQLPGSTGSVFGAPLADRSGTVLDWLRLNGKFLIASRGFSVWTLVAAILSSTLLNLLVLGPLLVGLMWLLSLPWWPEQWPQWLTLPGLAPLSAHDGFWLLLRTGLVLLAVFPIATVLFALLIGSLRLRSQALLMRLRVFMGRLLAVGLGLVAAGLVPMTSNLGEALFLDESSALLRALGGHLDWGLALLIGALLVWLGRARAARGREGLAMIGLSLLVYGVVLSAYHLAVHAQVVTTPVFAVLLALSVLLAFTCDINRVSMFAYYRSRLVGAFLPTVATGQDAQAVHFRLDQLGPGFGAPLPLVNTTLNTCSSQHPKLRARGGASFFLSPVWLGSGATGFRRSAAYAGDAASLGSAMTISAAAIDPDSHATRGRSISFLMALLNIRLGFWGLNPGREPVSMLPRPRWWLFIAREMLGVGLSGTLRHIHLSDGGHFENLGVYELIRRRARYIVVSDAGADPDLDFSDLGRLIERTRVDFGAEIELAVDALARDRDRELARRPWRLGNVRYSDGSSGRILYIKPMMCQGLSADIYTYWRGHPTFPDESTANQFFGEAQFEAYRALGWEIMGRLLGNEAPTGIAAWFDALAAQERGPVGSGAP